MTDQAIGIETITPEETARRKHVVLKTIRAVQGRCNWIAAVGILVWWTFWCGSAALLLDVALKLLGVAGWSWNVAGIALAVALIGGAVEFGRKRITLHGAAIRADQALNLKERLSSALELSIEHSPHDDEEAAWDTLLLVSAANAVGGINIREHFPLLTPREGRWVWCPLSLLFVSIFFLPAMDLWTGGGKEALAIATIPKEELNAETLQLAELAEKMRLEQNEKQERVAETSKLVSEIDDLAQKMKAGKLEKKEALAQLADLSDKIKQRRDQLGQDPNAARFKQSMMPQNMTYLGEAMDRLMSEEFEASAQALSQLEDRLGSGNLSEEQKMTMAEELQAMAQQLDPNSELAKALNNAAQAMQAGKMGAAQLGLQAAKLSLSDMQNLKRQFAMLDRASQAIAGSQMKLSGKSMTCSSCGAKLTAAMLKAGQCAQCGASCSGMGMSLSQFAGSRPWSAGNSTKEGMGMGGPGRGRGGMMPLQEDNVKLEDSMISGPMGDGRILGSMLVEGPPEKGRATVQFDSTVEIARQRGEEAMEKEQVPLAYRQHVRQYFYSLNAAE